MNQINQVHDDEIDLFELFQTLWDGKCLITAFVAIAVLLGGSFLLLKEAVYESKLIYSIHTLPPFYAENKASTDFSNKFYSASVFDEWKQNNSNTTLVFEDFSTTELVDGIVFTKDEDERLATLQSSFVLIKSNQLPILNDFFKYAKHINALLKDEYVVRAKEELGIIEARFKDLSSADSSILNTILLIDRFIISVEKGASIFDIQHPTLPKKASPIPSLILAMSIVLGGMVGVLFILVRNTITKRKEKLAKG